LEEGADPIAVLENGICELVVYGFLKKIGF
jgi:hypothetical protein